jgi:hypothetical protein
MNDSFQITDDQWGMIDARILACELLNALKLIRESRRVGTDHHQFI